MSRTLAVAATSLATLLLPTAAAHAGTLSRSGTTITYQAAPGEVNFVTVNWGNVGAPADFIPTLDDHADIVPEGDCTYDTALGGRCEQAGPNATFIVKLGDGNDFAQSINDRALGHQVEFYGEDGDDELGSEAGSDLLDGGAGNDTLSPDDDEAGPGDRVVGGPGEDTLQTGNPTGTNGPIGVSFDGVANDGYPGEADDYAPDLEDLSATSVSPSIDFVGNDAPNVVQLRSESADTVKGLGGDDKIDGANGNDVLDGGAGNDTIYGGGNDDTITGGPGRDSLSGEGSLSGAFTSVAGNDIIDARDGVAEQLNCGPGADKAIVDPLDIVPKDPGSLCEVVERSAAAAKAPSVRSRSLHARRSRISITLRCAKGGATCRGKVKLASVKKGKRRAVTLGTHGYTIKAGRTSHVKLKVSKKGRSLLKRTKKVKVRLTVDPKTGKKTTKTLTLRG